ncbi:muconolactone Delta-isomerase family protein [Celeribacter halophilus]|jgi:muconolactone D-isomerase|uniref:muconolactone Delta-isomerase n=1 Tax=Celeribacter halophilus TaxID=576117 RepID=UPI002FD03C56
MLYHVSMTVNLPTDMPEEEAADLKARETIYSQNLQTQGVLQHIWRVVGQFQNVSIFDCRNNSHLHAVLMGLPLRPYLSFDITPLSHHPSSIRQDDMQ